jgi:peptidyl-prolyl cis-trans isomerase D
MAAIGQIRKHSGLLLVVVGIALAAFVLGDFIKPSAGRPEHLIGEIDSNELRIQTFNERLSEQLQARRDQLEEDQRLTAQDEFQIRQQVWNQFVEEIIMGNQYEKIGLSVTPEELTDAFVGEQANRLVQQSFRDPNTGTFDPQVVANFIRNLDQQTPDLRRRYFTLENMVKEDILRTKFRNLLTNNYNIPEAFAQLDHLTKNKSADIRFVAPKYADVADTLVTVTDKHLRDYYNEFRHNYKQDETRTIDYVIFEVLPSEEDRRAIKSDVEHNYNLLQESTNPMVFINSVSDTRSDTAFKKESEMPVRIASELFNAEIGTIIPPYIENEIHYIAKLIDRQARPDSIKMSQILISYATAPAGSGISDRSLEQAEALVDSLLTVLNKNPKKYEEIALQYSDYPTVDEDRGDIGWIIDGDPNLAFFFNEGLNMKINEIGKMETGLGLHVVAVTDKTKPVEKVKVGIITRSIEPSSETFRQVYSQASKFAGSSRTIAQFNQEVANQGLNMRTAERLTQMSNRIAGIESSRQIIRWAFWESTKPGDVSSIFEDENQFVVAVLRELRAEGYQTFDQTKEQIRPLVLNRVKGDYLIQKINSLNIDDIYRLAENLNESVDTATNLSFSARNIPGYGREAEVIGTIFTIEPDRLSSPMKGSNAVFVVIVDRFNEAAEVTDFASVNFQLKNTFNSKVNNNAYLRALEEVSKIEDNRLLFY